MTRGPNRDKGPVSNELRTSWVRARISAAVDWAQSAACCSSQKAFHPTGQAAAKDSGDEHKDQNKKEQRNVAEKSGTNNESEHSPPPQQRQKRPKYQPPSTPPSVVHNSHARVKDKDKIISSRHNSEPLRAPGMLQISPRTDKRLDRSVPGLHRSVPELARRRSPPIAALNGLTKETANMHETRRQPIRRLNSLKPLPQLMILKSNLSATRLHVSTTPGMTPTTIRTPTLPEHVDLQPQSHTKDDVESHVRDKEEHIRLHLDAPRAVARVFYDNRAPVQHQKRGEARQGLWSWGCSYGPSIDANGNFPGWHPLISREDAALGAHKIDAAGNFREAPMGAKVGVAVTESLIAAINDDGNFTGWHPLVKNTGVSSGGVDSGGADKPLEALLDRSGNFRFQDEEAEENRGNLSAYAGNVSAYAPWRGAF